MSDDHNIFTETSSRSFFERIKSSFKGIIFGFLLILTCVLVLFYNEGTAIKTAKAIDEGLAKVISVDAQKFDKSIDGKLIHIHGKATTKDVLVDEDFDVEAKALKLARNVLMYQWVESKQTKTKKELGGSETTETIYSYQKQWSKELVNASNFKKPENHQNPSIFPFDSYQKKATNARIGAYKLNYSILNKMSQFSSLKIEKLDTLKFKNAKLLGNQIYIGEGTLQEPKIGDMKISFSIVPSGNEYSIIAKNTNGNLIPYLTKTGTRIELVSTGTVAADLMFENEKKQNKLTTWAIRILGFIFIYLGIVMILKPIVVFADVVPFIGNIVGFGLRMISFLLAIILWLLVVAIGWFFYRPIIGIVMLLITSVMIFAIVSLVKKKKYSNSSLQTSFIERP